MSVNQPVLAKISLHLEEAGDYLEHLAEELAEAGVEELPAHYLEQVERAYSDGVLWVARGAAGDPKALKELQVVAARMALWSWAGAEAARKIALTSWKAWLYAATALLGDSARAVFEQGLKVLIEAGLEELTDR